MKAHELHIRYATNPEGLDDHEFFVNGQWREISAIDTYRHPNAPILFEQTQGEEFDQHRVPREMEVPTRPRPSQDERQAT